MISDRCMLHNNENNIDIYYPNQIQIENANSYLETAKRLHFFFPWKFTRILLHSLDLSPPIYVRT